MQSCGRSESAVNVKRAHCTTLLGRRVETLNYIYNPSSAVVLPLTVDVNVVRSFIT